MIELTFAKVVMAFTTLLLLMIIQLCAGIWWASKINTTLVFLCRDLDALVQKVDSHSRSFKTKDDCLLMHSKMNKEIDDIWKAINSIREKQ